MTINEVELKRDVEREKAAQNANVEVVFISVRPDQGPNTSGKSFKKDLLTAQKKSAIEIRSHIRPQVTLNEIEKLYGGKKNISITEPIKKDSLKADYLPRLLALNEGEISQPFEDDGAITMMWRIKGTRRVTADETALLEIAREKRYESEIEKKFNAMISALMNGKDAVIKGCQER